MGPRQIPSNTREAGDLSESMREEKVASTFHFMTTGLLVNSRKEVPFFALMTLKGEGGRVLFAQGGTLILHRASIWVLRIE